MEKRIGRARLPGEIEVHLIDLPGIYSLEPRSEDERVARDVLTGRMPGVSGPDAVILILDSTNLGRHLGFAAPILSLGIPTLAVLNMADSLRSRGGRSRLGHGGATDRSPRGPGQRPDRRRVPRRSGSSWLEPWPFPLHWNCR